MTNEEDQQRWWNQVDWLGAVGHAIVTLAGPIAAPITFALRVREDLSPEQVSRLNHEASIAIANDGTTREFRQQLAMALPAPDPATVALYGLVLQEAAAVTGMDEPTPQEVGDRLAARLERISQAVHGNRKRLRRALAEHFQTRQDIVALLQDAKIKPGEINLNDSADLIWASALDRIHGDNPLYLLLLLAEAGDRRPAVTEFKPRYWLD
jgi:hypothetical protein